MYPGGFSNIVLWGEVVTIGRDNGLVVVTFAGRLAGRLAALLAGEREKISSFTYLDVRVWDACSGRLVGYRFTGRRLGPEGNLTVSRGLSIWEGRH